MHRRTALTRTSLPPTLPELVFATTSRAPYLMPRRERTHRWRSICRLMSRETLGIPLRAAQASTGHFSRLSSIRRTKESCSARQRSRNGERPCQCAGEGKVCEQAVGFISRLYAAANNLSSIFGILGDRVVTVSGPLSSNSGSSKPSVNTERRRRSRRSLSGQPTRQRREIRLPNCLQ